MDSVFKDPERMKESMQLPGIIEYSFVGESTPDYHARVEEIVVRTVGEDNIHRRTFRSSGSGAFTAYRFAVFHVEFAEVETIYREVGSLPGTKFLL